jgi:hypothetical protein
VYLTYPSVISKVAGSKSIFSEASFQTHSIGFLTDKPKPYLIPTKQRE